ncbi:MAG: hypothetical protein LKF52_04520 [Butyrivibrio sp.]|nr:hypothetical protein [Butyrivibrio sp.]
MSDYLRDELGEKFDYSAPLEPAQEAELSKKGFAKRIAERRKMRKQREKQFNLRAKAMWQIHQGQGEKKEDKEITPGIPENPMKMENTPIFGELRQLISGIDSLSAEQKQQAIELVNNANLWCSSMMSDEIPKSTGFVNKIDFDKIYKDLTQLETLLKGTNVSTKDELAMGVLLGHIDGMHQKLMSSQNMLKSWGGSNEFFRRTSIKDRLRFCNFGAALRTEKQQRMFKTIEEKVYSAREEKRLCDIEKKLKGCKTQEEKNKYLGEQVNAANARGMLYRNKLAIELNARGEGVNNYRLRKNVGFLETVKRDSEGNPLLSEESKIEKLVEIHEKRYGNKKDQIKDVVPYYMQQIDEMMNILRTMDFSPEGLIRMEPDSLGKVIVAIGEVSNIRSDEENLYNCFSKKDLVKIKMLDQNPVGTWNLGMQTYYASAINPEEDVSGSLDEFVSNVLFSMEDNTFVQRHLLTKRDENGERQRKVKAVDMNALMKEYIAEWDKMSASIKKSKGK